MDRQYLSAYYSTKSSLLLSNKDFIQYDNLTKKEFLKFIIESNNITESELNIDSIINNLMFYLYKELIEVDDSYYYDVLFINDIITVLNLKLENRKFKMNYLVEVFLNKYNFFLENNINKPLITINNLLHQFIYKQIHNDVFKGYYKLLVGSINLYTFIRIKNMNLSISRLKSELIKDENYSLWISLYGSYENKSILDNSNYIYFNILKEYLSNKDKDLLINNVDKILNKYIENLKFNNDFYSILFIYIYNKLNEINLIKKTYYSKKVI